MRPDASGAEALARIALAHVRRPWPHKADHVMGGPEDVVEHTRLHPVFPGSFDWHSCVHTHWLLARLLRRHPALPSAAAIRAVFAESFTAEGLAAELAYLQRPLSRGFERPYGWAWLLALAAELDRLPDPRWGATVAPLAQAFAARFHAFLPRADYPVRAGTHGNTAFALVLAADWAEGRDPALLALLRRKAEEWYGADADCQAWEPSGDDFLSSALTEALAMRRLLPRDRFAPWMAGFLPRLAEGAPTSLFTPVASATGPMGRSPISTGSTCRAPGAGAPWPPPSPAGIRAALGQRRRRKLIWRPPCATSRRTTWASTGLPPSP